MELQEGRKQGRNGPEGIQMTRSAEGKIDGTPRAAKFLFPIIIPMRTLLRFSLLDLELKAQGNVRNDCDGGSKFPRIQNVPSSWI